MSVSEISGSKKGRVQRLAEAPFSVMTQYTEIYECQVRGSEKAEGWIIPSQQNT